MGTSDLGRRGPRMLQATQVAAWVLLGQPACCLAVQQLLRLACFASLHRERCCSPQECSQSEVLQTQSHAGRSFVLLPHQELLHRCKWHLCKHGNSHFVCGARAQKQSFLGEVKKSVAGPLLRASTTRSSSQLQVETRDKAWDTEAVKGSQNLVKDCKSAMLSLEGIGF